MPDAASKSDTARGRMSAKFLAPCVNVFYRLLATAHRKAVDHHVNPRVFVALYLGSAVPFYLGIYLMLLGSGLFSVSWRNLLSFNLQQVHLSGGTVILGLLINRIAWALPYLYVELRGQGLAWYIHVGVWLWIVLSVISIL
jgi:hypothetical protein